MLPVPAGHDAADDGEGSQKLSTHPDFGPRMARVSLVGWAENPASPPGDHMCGGAGQDNPDLSVPFWEVGQQVRFSMSLGGQWQAARARGWCVGRRLTALLARCPSPLLQAPFLRLHIPQPPPAGTTAWLSSNSSRRSPSLPAGHMRQQRLRAAGRAPSCLRDTHSLGSCLLSYRASNVCGCSVIAGSGIDVGRNQLGLELGTSRLTWT